MNIMNKHILVSIIMIFILNGCNFKKGNIDNSQSQIISELDTIDNINETDSSKPHAEIQPIVYSEGIDILLPAMYRGTEPSDFEYLLGEDYYVLYTDSAKQNYYFEKAAIEIGKFYDDCLGDSTTYINAGYGDHEMLIIGGLIPHTREQKSIVSHNKNIWVGDSLPFTFGDQKYKFTTQGNVISEEKVWTNDGLVNWQEVTNYKLYLSTEIDGEIVTQLLIAIPSFNDTFVSMLFAGDLDNDGKPDFLFDTSRDYEEKAVVLFLSSKAKTNEIVRCVGESSYQFDC